LPSVFLGAPSSSDILGVLPGHRYLLQGQGLVAVRLSNLGALAGLIVGLCAFPLFMRVTAWFEAIPKLALGWIILAIPVIMALRDGKRVWAFTIAILASIYGLLGLQQPDPLFPMLSGLFGAATLLASIGDTNTIPKQEATGRLGLSWRVGVQVVFGGLVAGGLTAVLPGLGAAHAAVIGMLFAAGAGDAGFLVLTGVIGTTNFFLSLAAYASVEKARNGALLTATAIAPQFPLSAGIGAALFAGGVAFLITAALGRHAARIIGALPYRKLTIGVLCFVTMLVIVLNGWIGLVLYITGAALGLVAPWSGTARAHAMACILVPVGLRFVGF
jgi:putative membrane protein